MHRRASIFALRDRKDHRVRQIGTLPSTTDPTLFSDYLLSLGVTSRAVRTADGWAIWVHDEDKVEHAREELRTYEQSPNDPRYRHATSTADELRREQARRDRQYRRQVRDMTGRYDGLNVRRRPLTFALLVVCVAVYVAFNIAENTAPRIAGWVGDTFLFFSSDVWGVPTAQGPAAGLQDIHRGEVWRLVTPVFLHANLIHLAFNMWALWILGTAIEYTRSTRTLAALSLVSALVSNLGQYLYMLSFSQFYVPWLGFSGVVYAYFGYLWMKSRFEPEAGVRIHPSSVRVMLLWLVLGLTGFLNMANGAHIGGLLVGMLYGLARI